MDEQAQQRIAAEATPEERVQAEARSTRYGVEVQASINVQLPGDDPSYETPTRDCWIPVGHVDVKPRTTRARALEEAAEKLGFVPVHGAPPIPMRLVADASEGMVSSEVPPPPPPQVKVTLR